MHLSSLYNGQIISNVTEIGIIVILLFYDIVYIWIALIFCIQKDVTMKELRTLLGLFSTTYTNASLFSSENSFCTLFKMLINS